METAHNLPEAANEARWQDNKAWLAVVNPTGESHRKNRDPLLYRQCEPLITPVLSG